MAKKKITVLVASALVQENPAVYAGLYENVDADEDRAAYLIGIGAAKDADDEPAKKPRKKAETSTDGAPAADESEREVAGVPDPAKPAPARRAPRQAGK